MSDVSNAPAPAGGEATPAPIPDTGISIEQAVERFTKRQEEAAKQQAEPQASPAGRAPNGQFAKQESAPQEPDAAPAIEQPSGEDDGAEPADDLPPIKPPKFWDAARKEAFAALPRDIQEYVHERETARDTETSRARNEAAQARQAAEAERQQADEVRQRYEQTIQNALQVASGQMQGEFSDIKTQSDVMRLAEEDPFRFAKYQAHRENLQYLHNEAAQALQQRQKESAHQFATWADEQDKLFTEKAPEFADAKTAAKAREDTIAYLTEVGVPKAQLADLWSNPLFRDARMQLIIRNAVKWHNAQKSATDVARKPLPPVQRPGAARQSAGSGDIAALQAKFDKEPSVSNATLLREAKRAAAK